MAGIKISNLPAASSALLTDVVPASQGTTTYKETLAQIQTLFGSSASGGTLAPLNIFPFIVGPNGTYFTIQSAIDAAALVSTPTSQQIVIINPGTYVENISLKPNVHLSSAGGASVDTVVIEGNATYIATVPNEVASANGITFQTPIGGSPALSIQGAVVCGLSLSRCFLRGTTGTAFECLNANATVGLSTCTLVASAGQKISNVTGGEVRIIASFSTATDTASTISGGNFSILSSFLTNSFIVTNSGTTFSVTNSVVLSPSTLPFLNLGAATLAVTLFSSVLSNAASGFYVEGTGSIILDGINPIAGSATTVDPALTLIGSSTDFNSINLLQQDDTISMNNNFISDLLNPVLPQDAATKLYVDQTALNGTSVYAATTVNLTVTQAGAGVGATLTNAGALATFSIDGVNPPLGSNVLVKNLAAAQNEGIYTVTNVGSFATNWVLTRATSYDTATEINNTGLIVINNGATLAGQGWYNSATITTVDTTPFSFSRFGTTGTVTSVGSSTGLTGGPITSAGTLSFAAIAAHKLWANVTAGSAVPTEVNTNTFLQQVASQIFTTVGSQTYTPTTGMVYCVVELQGAGGSGGAVSGGTAAQGSAGSGAGAGGYCRKTYTAAQIGATAAVFVGTGGAGAAAGNNIGNTGGQSTFTPTGAGAVLTASGGVRGTNMPEGATGTAVPGGAGGAATGGDINIPGEIGGNGARQASGVLALGGSGGASHLGAGTPIIPILTPAGGGSAAGTGFGSGSSGAAQLASGNVATSSGQNGICIVTEFVAV